MAPSADQQTRVYEQLVQLVKDNIPNELVISESPGRVDVNTQKEIVIEGRKRPFLNLLSVIIQKHHVGFYHMPVYIDQDMRDSLSDTAAKMLKGKSCFHCKSEFSPELREEFAGLIRAGVELYRERGWI